VVYLGDWSLALQSEHASDRHAAIRINNRTEPYYTTVH
jgi:hypothetical protein